MPTNNETEWKDCWKKPVKVQYREITETTEIYTREGKLFGYKGKDVLLKGVKGEIYPCKKDIFKATYTLAKPSSEEKIRKDTAKQIFKELDNLHIVENWSTQKGKGIPLLLKQIGAYNALKKRFKVD